MRIENGVERFAGLRALVGALDLRNPESSKEREASLRRLNADALLRLIRVVALKCPLADAHVVVESQRRLRFLGRGNREQERTILSDGWRRRSRPEPQGGQSRTAVGGAYEKEVSDGTINIRMIYCFSICFLLYNDKRHRKREERRMKVMGKRSGVWFVSAVIAIGWYGAIVLLIRPAGLLVVAPWAHSLLASRSPSTFRRRSESSRRRTL